MNETPKDVFFWSDWAVILCVGFLVMAGAAAFAYLLVQLFQLV